MNELVNKVNEIEEVVEFDIPEDSGKGKLAKIAIGIGVAVAVGVGAFIYKNKEKIEERKVEKLRKKGYVIYKADKVEEDEN